jgi:ABC-type polysaccharide transport system permease subunit
MRAHHAIAIVAAILVGFGLKLIFFSAPIAEADVGSFKSASMDISEMHQHIKNLQVEKLHDMTFVFFDGD